MLVSKEGIPLVEVTRPNNFKDLRVAKALLRKLCQIYGQKKGRIFLGDAGKETLVSSYPLVYDVSLAFLRFTIAYFFYTRRF